MIDPEALADVREDDWILRINRDRTGIALPVGTEIVARPASEIGDETLAVVLEGGEHILRRAPSAGDRVVGVVVGVRLP